MADVRVAFDSYRDGFPDHTTIYRLFERLKVDMAGVVVHFRAAASTNPAIPPSTSRSLIDNVHHILSTDKTDDTEPEKGHNLPI